uniref:FACT complex subunit SSRP1 n=1 Tax=Rhabditophanes sp. KR3021 TaxID=114890 RepID=A0AC35UEQ7_9BILA
MVDAFHEFNDIFFEDVGVLTKGTFKISEQAFQFRSNSDVGFSSYHSHDAEVIQWVRIGNKPGLRFLMKEGLTLKFGGFKEADYDKLSKYMETSWKKVLTPHELAIKGWNQGIIDIKGKTMEFNIDGQLAFEVPLSTISNCNGQKNEAILEFHNNDDALVSLAEMRFHMPQDPDAEETDRVEEFKAAIMKYAGIETETDQPLTTFSQLLCPTPRGRYDVKVFPTHLSFHGKTYDYKINYKCVERMFLLANKDGRHVYFVLSINPPIRQGQTRYPFLVFEFLKDDHVEIDINLTPEQLKAQFNGRLEANMSGGVHEVVSKLLRCLVNKKITVPGSFISKQGHPSIDCAFKQASGFLYPLEKGFVYVHKPPMYIRFDEISCINFDRSDGSNKTFDFEIDLKSGGTVTFNNIDKDENNYLIDYVKSKGLNVRNAKKVEAGGKRGGGNEFDPYRETLRQEAMEHEEDDGMEDETDDDDYDVDADEKKNQEKDDSSEGSESSSDLEYSSGEAESVVSDEMIGAIKAHNKKATSGSSSPPPSERKQVKTKKMPAKEKKSEGSVKKDDGKQKKGDAKKKKEKDPNAPKKPLTAFFIWLGENRPRIKEYSSAPNEVLINAGKEWKELSSSDKKDFEDRAKVLKEEYNVVFAEYKKSGGGASVASTSKSSGSQKAKPPPKTKGTPSKVLSKEFVSESDSESGNDEKMAIDSDDSSS